MHNTTEVAFMSVGELADRIRSRELSPVEVLESFLERIQAYNSALNAFITICVDSARAEAEKAEQEISAGNLLGPLHGIPVVHKDNCWTQGVRTTAHSETLLDYVPAEDATFVRNLRAAGTVLLGKTNTTEFACGNTSIFGVPLNPWDLTKFSGASSAGSASAIAAGLAPAGTGTDTGGSIRMPSSFCGVVGLKPTYGRVSRYGLIPLSATMDTIGPISRTVRDNALLLEAMAGHDPRDPTSSTRPVPHFAGSLERGVRGVRIGVPRKHFFEGLEDDVAARIETAIEMFHDLGAEVVDVQVPRADQLADAAAVLVASEAFSQHASQLRKWPERYSPRARRRIASGAFYTAAEYLQACQIRRLWTQELERVMRAVDVLVTPTLRFTAFTPEVQLAGPPDSSWGTRQFNMSGHPAISIPCGFDGNNLPVGLQISGRYFDEEMVYRVAHAYEIATTWSKARPTLESTATSGGVVHE